jgi:hypothetical protein
MKLIKETIMMFSLFLLLCLVIQAAEVRRSVINVTIEDGVLEELEKSRPKEVVVYEVQPADSRFWMKRLTEIVGIKGKIRESKGLLSVKEGDRYLEVREVSGTAFYGDMGHLWKEQPTPEKTQFNVPINQETERIVRDWLIKLGFSRTDMKTLEISISDDKFEITVAEKKDAPISVVVGKNVEVRRRIDKLLVYGPGSKIKIYIGGNGKVNGLTAVWRQIIPNSSVLGHKAVREEPQGMKMQSISVRAAFEALQKNPLDHLPLALVDKIDIDEVHFGYFGRSAAERQKYLQPVYVFRGNAHATLPNGKRASVPYEQYVMALEKPLESIWPETRVFEPGLRRKGEVPKRGKDVDEKGG